MNKAANNDSKNENDKDKPNQNNWPIFHEVYEIIAPKFIMASGALVLVGISCFAGGNRAWGWFTACLAIDFFLLFLFEVLKSHKYPSLIRYTSFSVLWLAIFTVSTIGILHLLSAESPQLTTQTVAPHNPLIQKDSLVSKADTVSTKSLRHKKQKPIITKPKEEPTQKESSPQAPQQYPQPTIESLTFVTEPTSSSNADLPYAIRVTIQTNVKIERPHLQILCKTPIEDGTFFFSGGGAIFMERTAIGKNQLGQYGLDLSCDSPDFIPQRPIIATLFAKQPIIVIRVIHIPS